MKVLVIGANGQIGKILVNLLHESTEHSVRAMVRKQEQAETFAELGVETVLADLLGTVDEIAEAAKGCDAIVFTAGSGGHTGSDQTLLIDLDGAVKTVEAAEKTGIERFIMVSAFQANNRKNWNEQLKPYYAAKHYADRALLESKLTYTIVRPGGLRNEVGTGKIKVSTKDENRYTIPREDVARTVLQSLSEENTFCTSFDLVSGDQSIEDALKSL